MDLVQEEAPAESAGQEEGAPLDLGDVVSTGTAGRGPLAGGATHGLEEFRFRHYFIADRLADFPDERVLDYQEAVQRLSLQGGGPSLQLWVQGDAVALFSTQYRLDGELTDERTLWGGGLSSVHPNWWFGLEKIALSGRTDPGPGPQLQWALGDSYAAFGRGLALNVVKNTDVDIDTSLRGAHATLSAGAFELKIVEAVTNPQQVRLENPNVDMQPDRPHLIHGARADLYGRVHAGAHVVAWQFAREASAAGDPFAVYGNDLDATVTGATLDVASVGPFDLGGEFDWIGYSSPQLVGVGIQSGYAAYLSATAYAGPVILVLEGKRYRDSEHLNDLSAIDGYELSTGPSLEYERAITEDSSAALNSNDIAGGRARADLVLGENGNTLTPYLSVAAFRDEDLAGVHFNEAPETILHPVGGITVIAGEFHVLANAGYRMDLRDDAPADNAGDSTLHADAALTVPFGGSLSLELAPSLLKYHWGQNPVQQADYLDFSNALALKIGAPWALILYTDYSDNPLIDSTGNVSDSVYVAGEVQWMPGPATTLKLFYGAYRAGIRCAGGQCRSLPGFDGARVSLTANF